MILSETKKYIIAKLSAVAALLLAFAFQALAQAGQSALPQVAIESTRHDFGEAFVGEELMHVFIVRNTGNAPLELSQTKILGIRKPTSTAPRTLRVSFAPAKSGPG